MLPLAMASTRLQNARIFFDFGLPRHAALNAANKDLQKLA